MAKIEQKLQEIWQTFLLEVEDEVDPHVFENWIQPIEVIGFKDGELLLGVPNQFFKSWIEVNFQHIIEDKLENLLNTGLSLRFEILEKKEVKKKTDSQVKNEIINIKHNKKGKKSGKQGEFIPAFTLNREYTFDNFVVGPSNEFARGMALYVSQKPGKTYNPLFIYGGVGLGKTHLMQGIGHEILKNFEKKKVLYISTETFMNEMINSYLTDNIIRFRKKFRNIDVLLVDDIHFLTEKEGLQEEFFHTFNTLYEHGKQIVLTSDRPPKKIQELQERLVSRFGWGMVVDIQTPNLETRMAILKKKAIKENVSVPDDIINFIASRIKSNVRELEGALLKVLGYSFINEKDLTLNMAKEILKDIIHQKDTTEITIDIIQRTVATYYDIRVADLKAKKRTKNIAVPRQIAMYIVRELTEFSLPEIGELFGGRDHTTVIHAYNKISGLIESNHPMKYDIQNIINELKGTE